MHIGLGDIVIRDFERKDDKALHRIVREEGILRYMGDWAGNAPEPEDFHGFIDWLQAQKESKDVYENKRYAVALTDTDELIGMVGMGLEETLNEVEIAYFMSEKYQRRSYAARAVNALVSWCFQVSGIPYLILAVDSANLPSQDLAEKCGFTLFEKRTPVGHRQPNMVSDSYFYYRRYGIQPRQAPEER